MRQEEVDVVRLAYGERGRQMQGIQRAMGAPSWYDKRWLDYTGLTFDEMKGWDGKKVQHPDHVDRVVARVER